MGFNGLDQIGGAAIMQKEQAPPQAPKGRGAKLIGASRALMNAIR